MAKRKFDVVAITGKYTDRSGTEKKQYRNIGVVLENDKGMMLKMENIPVGWDGWAYFYEPRSGENQPPAAVNKQAEPAPFDDDITF